MKNRVTTSRQRRALYFAALVMAVFVCMLPARYAFATTPAQIKGGITVSPAIVNLVLPPGQQEAKSTITITNNYDKPVHLAAEWQAIDEATGRLIPFGPLGPELTKSLSISETDLTITPRVSKQVTVTVHNNPSLAPGGHYATLVFTEISSGNEKLGLQSALSVTVFIVKRDGARTSIELTNFTAGHNLFTLPSGATIGVTNTGNVHVIPRAAITIERKGNVIAKAIANETSAPLLPSKQNTFTVRFVKLSRVYWPSRLQLRVTYRADQAAEVNERVSSFWYVPPYWPFLFIALMICSFFLVRKIFAVLQKRRKRNRNAKAKPSKTPAKPATSQIDISAVGVSPSHTVPVSKPTKKVRPESTVEKITVKIIKNQKPKSD